MRDVVQSEKLDDFWSANVLHKPFSAEVTVPSFQTSSHDVLVVDLTHSIKRLSRQTRDSKPFLFNLLVCLIDFIIELATDLPLLSEFDGLDRHFTIAVPNSPSVKRSVHLLSVGSYDELCHVVLQLPPEVFIQTFPVLEIAAYLV